MGLCSPRLDLIVHKNVKFWNKNSLFASCVCFHKCVAVWENLLDVNVTEFFQAAKKNKIRINAIIFHQKVWKCFIYYLIFLHRLCCLQLQTQTQWLKSHLAKGCLKLCYCEISSHNKLFD